MQLLRGLIGICVLLLTSVLVEARPLDREECSTLQEEQQQLVRQGVREQVAGGAAWGKKHLDARQIELVEKYLGLEEQLLFRCKGEPRQANMKRKLPAIVPLPSRNIRRIKAGQPDRNASQLNVAPAPFSVQPSKSEKPIADSAAVAGKSSTDSGFGEKIVKFLSSPASQSGESKPPATEGANKKALDYHNQDHPENANAGGTLIKTKPKWVQDIFAD